MEKIDLTKYIRLPKFLATAKYIENLSKFFSPGNYVVGKQQVQITGCDLVMPIYSELIPTLPEEKIKSLAPSIEITAENASGFVFVWLYMNGAITSMLNDNEVIEYKFDKFMGYNYSLVEILGISEWINYFQLPSDIDNKIAGIIGGGTYQKPNFYSLNKENKETLELIYQKAAAIYWNNPWKYYNYGELAQTTNYWLTGKHRTSLPLYELGELIKYMENPDFPLDTEINRRLARQYIHNTVDRLTNHGLYSLYNNQIKTANRFIKELNIDINLQSYKK